MEGSIPIFKTDCKATKTVWYWYKDRHVDQGNRIENPEIKSYMCSVDFQQGCRDHSMGGENSVFNKWYWDNRRAMRERMKWDPYFTP